LLESKNCFNLTQFDLLFLEFVYFIHWNPENETNRLFYDKYTVKDQLTVEEKSSNASSKLTVEPTER